MASAKELRIWGSANIMLEFDEYSDLFVKQRQLAYEKEYRNVIAFLKRRGFIVRIPKQYQKGEHFEILAKDHRIAIKNDVFILIELQGRGLEFEIGNFKNLWDTESSSWKNGDDRMKPMSYLENCAVKLERLRLIEYFERTLKLKRYDRNDSSRSPEQVIIDNLKCNTHIHGVVSCLDDIAKSMANTDSHNYRCNSFDRDRKRIICGQKKAFYSYDNRIGYGVVWHHINNMWWVICGDQLRNVAAFELFDYAGEPPRRRARLRTVERHINKAVAARNYLKADKISRYHKILLKESEVSHG